jgi:hypothetical protein
LRISVGEASGRGDKGGPETRGDAFFEGIWWPADREDLQAEGRVSVFGDGSVWLDASADAWGAVPLSGEDPSVDVRVLYGCGLSGTPMSLHGARLVGGERMPIGDRAHVRYVADRLIHGAAVETEDDLRLASVRTSFRGLREWLSGWAKDTETPLPLVRPSRSEGGDRRVDE